MSVAVQRSGKADRRGPFATDHNVVCQIINTVFLNGGKLLGRSNRRSDRNRRTVLSGHVVADHRSGRVQSERLHPRERNTAVRAFRIHIWIQLLQGCQCVLSQRQRILVFGAEDKEISDKEQKKPSHRLAQLFENMLLSNVHPIPKNAQRGLRPLKDCSCFLNW